MHCQRKTTSSQKALGLGVIRYGLSITESLMLRIVLAENVAWMSAKRFLHVKKEIRMFEIHSKT